MDLNIKSKTIFVVGNSRSGTTMMGRIMGLNKRVFTFNELHFFEELWSPKSGKNFLSITRAIRLTGKLITIQRGGYLLQKDPKFYFDEARKIVENLKKKEDRLWAIDIYKEFLIYETKKNGKQISCEQTPRNVFYIREILNLFPEAKFINMIRCPGDVLLSQKNKRKLHFLGAKQIPLRESFRSWVNYHPITISKLWNASIKASELFKKDKNFILVRFEELIEKPVDKVCEICKRIGIQFEMNMLNIPQVGSSLEPDHPDKRGINKERTGSWQKGGLNSAEIYLMQKITWRQIEMYGYETIKVFPNPFLLAYYLLSFVLKLGFAFILNLNRMRSIKDALKRRFFT